MGCHKLYNVGVVGQRVRSSEFTWNAATRAFVTDASDYGHQARLFARLYADACDVGFVLVSARTGEEAPFYLDESATERDGDGDVQSWTFRPIDAAVRRNPGLRGVVVRVFND